MLAKKILVDIGSSTIKVYEQSREQLKHLVQRTISFKDGFDPEGGISKEGKKNFLS